MKNGVDYNLCYSLRRKIPFQIGLKQKKMRFLISLLIVRFDVLNCIFRIGAFII